MGSEMCIRDRAQFYLFEARRLAEAATISAQTDNAEKLRNWIFSSWPDKARSMERDPRTILPGDVVQYGPGAMRETKTVKSLLTVLADHGWLVRLEDGAVVDGKSRALAYQLAEVRP